MGLRGAYRARSSFQNTSRIAQLIGLVGVVLHPGQPSRWARSALDGTPVVSASCSLAQRPGVATNPSQRHGGVLDMLEYK